MSGFVFEKHVQYCVLCFTPQLEAMTQHEVENATVFVPELVRDAPTHAVLVDLSRLQKIPAGLLPALVLAWKAMDGADRRLPRDGAIAAEKFPGIARDIRVGSSLTIKGERLVLRLMPDSENLNSLASLGFYDDQFDAVRRLLRAPYGLFLVVGPVGVRKKHNRLQPAE